MEKSGQWNLFRAALGVAVAFGVIGARASTPMTTVVPGPQPTQQEFSCQGKPLDLSREEIEKIALSEYERRGGVLRPGEFEVKLRRDGCDWWVGVLLSPPRPGGHFGVVVDGLTGRVKQYIPGA